MDQSKESEPRKSQWAKREEEILAFWQDRGIFEKTLKKNEGKKHFVFYDGPPFATGLPHYGHLLASVIKDAIPRYQTMKGKYVRRVWGWDCHGLPVETLIEKELGLEHKKDIERYGIGKFNKAAQESVLRYDAEWKKMIPRIGRFIDMDHSYKTMDAKYTESIWWAFKEMYDKGLVYKGYKSMHICPRCETTLSTTEVADGYKDITDISVTVKFELVDEPGTFVLAWTTTPWTLPGNVALAVGEEIVYVLAETEGQRYIVAKERMAEVFKGKEFSIDKEFKGKNLVGKSYKPVFDYYRGRSSVNLENKENGWKIYAADFVTTESGTGVVHIAPAFGEDDMNLGKQEDLPFIQHVKFDGTFTDDVKDFAGRYVKPKENPQETDIEIIKHLAHAGKLFSKEKIAHSYPHCWRCDTPLLNYATSSWFIKVTELRDTMARLNKKVCWVPESVGEGRFGNWLENARDWSISRTRFWGAPLPVWECTACGERRVPGSVEEMKKFAFPPRNKYIVMRHGEAESNASGMVSSKIATGDRHHLTEKGKAQVADAVKKLKREKVDMIISSPFLRTKETAQLVARGLGMNESDVVFDDRLKEIDTGIFDGRSTANYHAHFKETLEKLTKRPPDGENIIDVKGRMMAFMLEMERAHEGKTILVVTHEYPTWALFAAVDGLDKENTARIKDEGGEDFIVNAEVREIKLAPLPRNEDMELDMHRPYIDEIILRCDCRGEMKRITDVFDCWVESGSMPFAQFHYPFENEKEFKNNFPADFIAEGLDQTRGWFYTMLVLGAALFHKAPYRNVAVNGLILAEDGRKMSKRLKNYPEPWDVVHKYGADALRLYLLSSPVVRGEELRFSEKEVDEAQKKVISRLLNVVSFYKLYEDARVAPDDTSKYILDEWIIARLRQTIGEIEEALDRYELDRAVRPIGLFVDDLSTWYLRRSRERFKGEDVDDKRAALATTRFVLREFAKILAPFMPFVAEELYQTVENGYESIHLEEWPRVSFLDSLKQKSGIFKQMKEVRNIVSLGLEARAKVGIKVRQPLGELRVKEKTIREDLVALIKDEVNVKEVVFDSTIDLPVALDIQITPELKKEGQFRDLVRAIQDMRKKEQFTPDDRATISFETTEAGEAFVEEFKTALHKATPLREVRFETVSDGEEVQVDDLSFKIRLAR